MDFGTARKDMVRYWTKGSVGWTSQRHSVPVYFDLSKDKNQEDGDEREKSERLEHVREGKQVGLLLEELVEDCQRRSWAISRAESVCDEMTGGTMQALLE